MNLVSVKHYQDFEIKAIQNLPAHQQNFVLAMTDVRIKTQAKNISVNGIYDTLKVTELDSGLTKIENIDLINLAGSTYDLIIDKYPSLTFQEFKILCKNGVVNTYGDWYGMCLKTIAGWIKAYTSDEVRKASLLEWNKQIELLAGKTTEVPVHLKAELSKKGCVRFFEFYKENKRFDFFPHKYYDMINDFVGVEYKGFKTLVTDPEKRKEIFALTETEYEKQLLYEKFRCEKRGHLRDAEAIMEKITLGFKEDEILKNRQKTLMLKYYFDELINNNKPLEL